MTMLYDRFIVRLGLMLQGLALPNVEREDGQTLGEYAMILGLIAVFVTAAILFMRGPLTGMFSAIGSAI
jgi:Flp pilus assembly pilin Flp